MRGDKGVVIDREVEWGMSGVCEGYVRMDIADEMVC